jgi:hypothetical protein
MANGLVCLAEILFSTETKAFFIPEDPLPKVDDELSEHHEEVFCFCQKPYDHSSFMIACDICDTWYHGDCVGITEAESAQIDRFYCENCAHEFGVRTDSKRPSPSSRRRKRAERE